MSSRVESIVMDNVSDILDMLEKRVSSEFQEVWSEMHWGCPAFDCVCVCVFTSETG